MKYFYGSDDISLTKEKFLCRVELARKTPLSYPEIEIIAERRSQVPRVEKPELNTFARWTIFLSRKYAKLSYRTSVFDIRRQVIFLFRDDDLSISKDDFISMVKFAQNTPLSAEEIEIIIKYRSQNPLVN